MLNITKKTDGSTVCYALEGRLDTFTSKDLDREVNGTLSGVTKLIFDMADLEYISSAGLRVLLSAQKIMMRQGEMILRNVSDVIMEVFVTTGFVDILTIE